MSCVIRECEECNYVDGKYPPNPNDRWTCPRCGGRLAIEFDEYADHELEEERDDD